MPESIDNLTRAIASGDAEAFARFFDRYFAPAMHEASRVVRADEATQLDIVQEAMMRFIRSGNRFDTEAQLMRWLQLTIRSCAYDRFRAEIRRRRVEEGSGAQLNGSPGQATQEDLTRLHWLRTEIASLRREEQDLVTMRHRFGWTLQQIADTLRLTPGAVDGRLRRILSKLRKNAEEHGDVTPESE